MEVDNPTRARKLRTRIDGLQGRREHVQRERDSQSRQSNTLADYLERAPLIEQRLDQLSDQLFGQLVSALEQNLSTALQEVLEQPLQFKVERESKRGAVHLSFHVERDECREDIMRGQGGSVANVLSVGLRFFALATLDEQKHRRFLVLDEQDCWLRPDLVPKLVKVVHDAGKALGFQVLMISHHDVASFDQYADRMYEFIPMGKDGVVVREIPVSP